MQHPPGYLVLQMSLLIRVSAINRLSALLLLPMICTDEVKMRSRMAF